MSTQQGTTPNSSAPAGTLAADPGFATFDAETQGFFKNRGLDSKPLMEVISEVSKSYREAAKFTGVPPEQLLRLPKDASDAEGWKNVWKRLGAPEKADGYDFKEIKYADGKELDDAFKSKMGAAFHNRGVPADTAREITKEFIKLLDDSSSSETAERTAKLATERDALAKSWGANMEANKFIVRQAALKTGLTPEITEALEKSVGYEKTMQHLLKIGMMLGEDKYVANPNAQIKGVMTKEQAVAKKVELRDDPDFVKRFNAGDHKAVAEMNALDIIVAS